MLPQKPDDNSVSRLLQKAAALGRIHPAKTLSLQADWRRYWVVCLLLIFAAAFIVRIVCMLFLRSWNFSSHSNFISHWMFGEELGVIGQALMDGRGFTLNNLPTAEFPPVYPFLIGGLFYVFGAYSTTTAVILFLFQSTCAAVTAICLTVIGSHLFNKKVGIIAGLAWAFYPSSLYFSVKIIWYSELELMLIFLIIAIATSQKSKSFFPKVAFLGGLSGLLILTDSAMMIYTALLLFWMLVLWKVGPKKLIGLAIIWGLGVGVVLMPWAIRNWMVLGAPEVLKSSFGVNLCLGNNPYSSGGTIDEERKLALAALNQDEYDYYKAQPERVFFGYLQDKAVEWIRMHPKRFVELTVIRFWQFWGKFPSGGPDTWQSRSWLHLVWYTPCAVLALFGLWYAFRRRLQTTPIWLFLLVYPLPYYVTHVQHYRYRYPVEPFLVLLAAISLSIWFERYDLASRARKYVDNVVETTAPSSECGAATALDYFGAMHRAAPALLPFVREFSYHRYCAPACRTCSALPRSGCNMASPRHNWNTSEATIAISTPT
jgi:hypothetical protein